MNKVFHAEWEQQDAIVIAWPNKETDWKNNLDEVEKTYIEISNQISDHQKLIILSDQKSKVLPRLSNHENVFIIHCDYNDTWTRDYIGISVSNSQKPQLLNFKFNGWGNKFDAQLDNEVNSTLNKLGIIKTLDNTFSEFVMEGGSVESNGEGIIITTSDCLLNNNRNNSYNKVKIESILKDALGVKTIIWLNNGAIEGDDTDSHIDTLVRFCNSNTLVYVKGDTPELKKMEEELIQITSKHKLKLVPLPTPKSNHFLKDKLPATYANFLITNKKVLVPIYDDKNDDIALKAIDNVFPDREIVGINCTELIKQNGSLHCVTMQIHKNVLNLSLLNELRN